MIRLRPRPRQRRWQVRGLQVQPRPETHSSVAVKTDMAVDPFSILMSFSKAFSLGGLVG